MSQSQLERQLAIKNLKINILKALGLHKSKHDNPGDLCGTFSELLNLTDLSKYFFQTLFSFYTIIYSWRK